MQTRGTALPRKQLRVRRFRLSQRHSDRLLLTLTFLQAHLNTLQRRLADKIIWFNVKPPSSALLV